MITLGIETSCDETALALIETTISDNSDASGNHPISYKILAQTVFSQIDIHAVYGGVFPIVAKREHARRLIPLLEHILREAKMLPPAKQLSETGIIQATVATATAILAEKESELLKHFLDSTLAHTDAANHPPIDRIAVTRGPGLEPALWVGVNFARTLSAIWNIPIMPTNHMEGHIIGSLMPHAKTAMNETALLLKPQLPAIALLISGGHTELVKVVSFARPDSYTIVGATLDDAVGEAYDKVARMMNIPYPGGPKIALLAEKARARFTKNAQEKNSATNPVANPITLPRPMLHSKDLNFSFSGLKTSVLYLIEKIKTAQEVQTTQMAGTGTADTEKNTAASAALPTETIENIALAFEDAVTEVLVTKTRKALLANEAHTLIVGGGVIANRHIHKALSDLASELNIELLTPPQGLAGDNAVMIAIAGAFHPETDTRQATSVLDIAHSAQGNLSLEN